MKMATAVGFGMAWLVIALAGAAWAADVRVETAATNALPARPNNFQHGRKW